MQEDDLEEQVLTNSKNSTLMAKEMARNNVKYDGSILSMKAHADCRQDSHLMSYMNLDLAHMVTSHSH